MSAIKPSKMLSQVLTLIKPSKKERKEEQRFAKAVAAKVRKAVPKGCRVAITGSIAKGTFLRDSKDLDIFVLFSKTQPKERFESLIVSVVKKAFPGTGYQLSYAEHPYARFHHGGRRVDLVPAYAIKHAGERLSAVDRSVLHTKYILKNMKIRQKDGVLLLKKLLKANGLYGAEIKIEGFPGYLCELLVLRYRSFMGLVSAAALWNPPTIIDLERHYKTKKEIPSLPKRFGPGLIVIDPTDRNRNVAAAVSLENLKRYILLCRRLQKNPKEDHFLRAPETFEQKLEKLAGLSARFGKGSTLLITLPKPEIVDDVLWGQLRKLMKQLYSRLESDGFELPHSDMIADDSENKIRIAFAVKNPILPAEMEMAGPMLGMHKNVADFRKHHTGAKFVKRKNRIFAVVKREIRTPEASVRGFFKELNKKGKSHLAFALSEISIRRA